MRIAIALSLSAALAGTACKSAKQALPEVDADISTGCQGDTSTGVASAQALAMLEKATGMICPRTDQDFFRIEVAPGTNLLDVSLAYPSALSKVVLQARLFAADGTTQVPNAIASDTDSTDGKNALATTFAVAEPGSYILRVSDAGDANADSLNSYVLQVAAATDPDPHEPNDTAAQAKPADGAPGYFSSVGDIDTYPVAITQAGSLLRMLVGNPAAAKSAIEYEIKDSTLKVLATGTVAPAATPADLTGPAPATGTLFVSLHAPANSAPDRRPEAGYTLVLAESPETDANDKPPRNDTPATATCMAGGSPCTAVFSGTTATFGPQSGTIGSRGDRDFFLFRATSAPAVVEATVRMPATSVNLALDVLVPDLTSPCQTDADCKVLAATCTTDDDCELSHHCIDAKAGACTSATCRQCAGASMCLPLPDSTSKKACGVVIYSMTDADGGAKTGSDGFNTLRTAQPVFVVGPVFLIVHDHQDERYDTATTYTLTAQVVPEPDPMDNSTDPNARNNFYNPYPLQKTNLEPSKRRARDITAQLTAGTPVEGWLSYPSDEDWFSFAHPCPGSNCGLVFEWLQPGPSAVRPVFMMRTADLTMHESWTYAGTVPTTASSTGVFGDGDCTECSFASAKHAASGTTPYRYYLQVRDAGADHWDFSASGRYQFSLKSQTPGCPLACSEGNPASSADAGNAGPCGCFCKSLGKCPAPIEL